MMLTQTFPKLVSITCRRLCLTAQGLCLYRTRFCFWGETSLGSRAAVNTSQTFPASRLSSGSKPLFQPSVPATLTFPIIPPTPEHLLLLFPLPEHPFPHPDPPHSHSLSLQVSAERLQKLLPDSPHSQTTSCPPKLNALENTLCLQTFHGL